MTSETPGNTDPSGRPRRVFIHVGAPKTGTTFLQNVLWQNREALARSGLCYPGAGSAAHHQAALDLRGAAFGRKPTQASAGGWDRLTAEASEAEGDVLISSELLAWATPRQVDRAFNSLSGFDEAHLVMTLRDLRRQVPAVWQEEVKNRRTMSYAEFLERAATAGPDDHGPGGIWMGQDPRLVLSNWAEGLTPQRVHVVTLPPVGAPSGLLWERFCSVLGIRPEAYDTEVRGSNVGIGLAEAEALRRLNLQLSEAVRWPQYAMLVKHGLAESSLARTGSQKIVLPEAYAPALARRTKEITDALRVSNYDLVGDLEDLDVRVDLDQVGEPSDGLATPAPEAVVEASIAALAEAVEQLASSRRRVARLRRGEPDPGEDPPPAEESGASRALTRLRARIRKRETAG